MERYIDEKIHENDIGKNCTGYGGISGFGAGIRYHFRKERLRNRLGLCHERVYLCRFHAVCGNQSAVRWCIGADCCTYRVNGKCTSSVLRNIHDYAL